jgi:zinc/manganese transport system substrate-binding protein
MNKLLILFLYILPQTILAGDRLNVAVSIPDLGDMARRVGGDKVKVTTLATGREDLHAVPVRPSFLPVLNRADLLLTLGLDAEHAWLPALAAEARNPDIMEGRSGWIETSKGIEVLDVPQVLDRSEGEQHPEGNPHYNIGPQCGTIMARNIFEAFADASPHHTPYFEENLERYLREIDSTVSALKKRSAVLRGVAVIDFHPDVSYLCEFYGMKIVGHIEPKAGVSPTAAHLRKLEALGTEHGVRLIIHNQSQSPKIPGKLGSSLGRPVVEIANAVGAKKQITTWLQLQEYNNRVLLDALGQGK